MIEQISIEAFRGFNNRVDLRLDSSAVIIWGANGRGKTSIADALQWLLLGRIARLEGLKNRTTEEFIVNTYAGRGTKARVELSGLFNGTRINAHRTGDRTGSVLELNINGTDLIGSAAELRLRREICGSDLPGAEFERYVLSMGLLQQDVVRGFLAEEKPSARYEMLSRLLGLRVLDDFVQAVNASAEPLKAQMDASSAALSELRRRLEDMEERRREMQIRVNTFRSYRSLEEELRELAAESSILAPWAGERIGRGSHDVADLMAQLRNAEADIALILASDPVPPVDELEQLRILSEGGSGRGDTR